MIRACVFISLYDRSVLYSIMQILYYLINSENNNPKTDYNYTFTSSELQTINLSRNHPQSRDGGNSVYLGL